MGAGHPATSAPARSPEVVHNADIEAAVAGGPDQRASASERPEDDAQWYEKAGGALDGRWLAGLVLAITALARRRRG